MRSACNGLVKLDGINPTAVIGADGDYLRQPDFSAGAWRTSAVTLGGMGALTAEMRRLLVQRERDRDPYQRSRVGKALIAQETARFWVGRAAIFGEAFAGNPDDIANTVNLVVRVRLLFYPVWAWLLPPEQHLPITLVRGARLDVGQLREHKRSALAAHASQCAGLITDDTQGFQLPHDLLATADLDYEVFLEA